MKLHLGSGFKRFDGFVNVDFDKDCNPDFLVDLENDIWPFEDNSVDEVIAHHVLEHIGPNFFSFLKELYRVTSDGAIIHIVVPHHRHDCFINDPTHRRPITVEGMRLFSKSFNNLCKDTGDGSSKLGLYYDVDFEIIKFNFLFDELYSPLLTDMTPEKEKEIQLLIREKNNVILETHITLQTVKS